MKAHGLRDSSWIDFLGLVFRSGLGVVFLLSSIPKIHFPFIFLSNVYDYQLLGPASGAMLAIVLPWLELALAVALFAGILLEGAFLGSIVLTSVFIIAQVAVLHRGLSIGCSCFGSAQEPVGYRTLLRTCLVLGIALAGLWTQYRLSREKAAIRQVPCKDDGCSAHVLRSRSQDPLPQ
jgi:uncharacterized membrane protein YphA (DoxX/SURF4 family)